MLLILSTYNADEWTCVKPAEFPEFHWIVANHFFDTIVESINAKCPRNRYAFEEDKEEQTKTANCIRVQYLKDIHATLLVSLIVCNEKRKRMYIK